MEDISLFYEAPDINVVDFWWCLLWVSKQAWIRHLHVVLHVCSGFLRFTCGVTLMASIAAEPLVHVQALVEFEPGMKCMVQCALWPSEAFRLGRFCFYSELRDDSNTISFLLTKVIPQFLFVHFYMENMCHWKNVATNKLLAKETMKTFLRPRTLILWMIF